MSKKKNPIFSCLNGRWKCTYVQVPYDDRYFRIYRQNQFGKYTKVAQFSRALYDGTKDDHLFPFLSRLRELEAFEEVDRFHNWLGTKVKEHDEYLDRNPQ